MVSDADAELNDLEGVRDATPMEAGEVPMEMAEAGHPPLPEEHQPTPDDTRGRRPKGTPEMGHDKLRG